jgi:4-hydroxy-tetrahydrodipicolinate reductase
MIRVLVNGAGGRMGREAVAAITAAEGMSLVAAVDPVHAGEDVGGGSAVAISGDLASAITESAPHVMVDFTRPDVVEAGLAVALAAGVHCVVGTTGLAEETLRRLSASAPDICLFVAPNFAIGAVLMMRFAAEAARHLPHVEIIELHHDRKADAPSGTALRTASFIAEARALIPDAPGRETEIAEGARGALVDDVTIHSVRLPGLVAHQEVIFGGTGETLTLRHDSLDRSCFMPGVVLAVRKTVERRGLVIGLEHYLEDVR